jgi:hypothetical protein
MHPKQTTKRKAMFIICILILASVFIFLEIKYVSAGAYGPIMVCHKTCLGLAPQLPEKPYFRYCHATSPGTTMCSSDETWLGPQCNTELCARVNPDGTTQESYVAQFLRRGDPVVTDYDYQGKTAWVDVSYCAQACFFCAARNSQPKPRCKAAVASYFGMPFDDPSLYKIT